jgi:hypothetical protein
MANRSESRQKFLNAIATLGKSEVSRPEVFSVAENLGIPVPQWFLKEDEYRVGRGLYRVPQLTAKVLAMPVREEPVVETKSGHRITNVTTDLETEDLVPKVYANYVPFGNFDDILNIVKSNKFYPVFITGQSGNGKTMSVEQACAKAKRKFICVSMTPDTDESDLLGNYVLINGQMEWRDGPVTVAARQGAVLCIDEIDYGANNLAALQRVLEGKPFLLKKKNELVAPAPGFTIIATANTKGKGSDDGRYMYTNVLNEAFLERFINTMEQDWPTTIIERKIIKKETFAEGGVDEVISTRRLVHITRTFGVFGNKMKAIELCLNRFDIDTKTSFLDLYTKVDAGANTETIMAQTQEEVKTEDTSVEIPF